MTERKKYEWLTENSRLFLSRGYLLEGVTPEQRIREIAEIAQDKLGIDGFADKFEDYMSKGWYSLSTPVWTNFGNNRGLPISCFGSYVNDNMADILKTAGEVGMMSKYGGGTSGYFGDLRPRGAEITNNGHSSGAVHFVKLFEQITDTVSQGCYDDETEVLTDKGFLPFETVIKDKSIKVAQVTDEDEIEFVKPLDYMKFIPEDNELLLFKDTKNINLLVTKNHNMVFKRDGRKMVNGVKTRYLKPEYKTAEAEFAPLHRDIHYAHGSLLPSKGRDSGLTDLERLYIAIQADGTLVRTSKEEQNAIRFRFIKKRKSDRVEELLNNLEIKYSISQYTETDNSYNIYFNLGYKAPKLLEEWVTLEDKSLEWAEDFIDEVSFWDGSIRNEEYSSFSYSSTIKSNVDIIQAIASMCGYKSYMVKDLRENEPNKSTIYKIDVAPRSRYFGVEKLKTVPTEYNGYVYCVEVPSHKLIVRRGGRTLVCGNSSRRGRFAPYLPIDHKDIDEFLEIGTEGNEIQDVNHAVTITDAWMLEMIGGDSDKRKTWAKVLQRRVEMGYPYIFFTDTVNNNKPEWYADTPITHSNLCSEIALPDNEDWSFVCNLSSMNVLHFDEWKDTDAVETMIYFLDAVMSDFIEKLERLRDSEDREDFEAFMFMEKAYNFAVDNRALGLGVLGLHSLLQSKMIAFESVEASLLNEQIFKIIKEKSEKASEELAAKYGEPRFMKGTGRRNSTLVAVAPTTSSAFILGQVSQSIEPIWSNNYVKDVAKAKVTVQNPYLKEILAKYGKDTRDTWIDIRNHDGSVQHLDYLTPHEKEVFKTFSEINQYEVINQASVRQKYIDQGQSLNVMVNPKTTAKELNELYLYAWENGIKTLYYQHSTNAAQKFYQTSVCLACEA